MKRPFVSLFHDMSCMEMEKVKILELSCVMMMSHAMRNVLRSLSLLILTLHSQRAWGSHSRKGGLTLWASLSHTTAVTPHKIWEAVCVWADSVQCLFIKQNHQKQGSRSIFLHCSCLQRMHIRKEQRLLRRAGDRCGTEAAFKGLLCSCDCISTRFSWISKRYCQSTFCIHILHKRSVKMVTSLLQILQMILRNSISTKKIPKHISRGGKSPKLRRIDGKMIQNLGRTSGLLENFRETIF